MNANELLDIIGETRNEYIMDAQRHRSGGKAKKRRIPAKRVLLIAAVIALLVAMVGFAAVVLNLDSLNLGQFSFDAGFGETKTMDVISLQGFTGSKNYLAAQEWQSYLAEYDPNGELLKQADNDLYFPPAEYESYMCYTEEMVQKVDEICEKYSLELLGPRYPDSGIWATYTAVGIKSIFVSDTFYALYETSGYHYGDGTFQVSGVVELNPQVSVWSYPTTFQYRSVQKTSFDGVYINVRSTDHYEQWEYTTVSGDELLMALSPESALMFYDGDDAFVTVSVISPQYGEAYMDKAALEDFADTLLFEYSVQPVEETPVEDIPHDGDSNDSNVTEVHNDTAGFRMFESVFLPIAEGKVGYSMDEVRAHMERNGYTSDYGEGMLSAYDPENPGSWISSTLTNENVIVELGDLVYCLVTEDGERTVRVTRLRTDSPVYSISESFLEKPVEVQSLEELKAYLYGEKTLAEVPVMKITFRDEELTDFTGAIGEETHLELKCTAVDMTAGVTWTSTDETVCAVTGDTEGCVITVKGEGSAAVTAECNGVRASVIVRGIQSW